jgi:uncharacterized protein YaaQ
MKLIIAILKHEDAENVSNALVAAHYRVTQIASTGGFLRHGSNTLMIGLDGEKVDEAFDIIRKNCTPSTDPATKRGTLFVLNVAQFEQL